MTNIGDPICISVVGRMAESEGVLQSIAAAAAASSSSTKTRSSKNIGAEGRGPDRVLQIYHTSYYQHIMVVWIQSS